MIARVPRWLIGRRAFADDRADRITELEARLSEEQLLTAHLNSQLQQRTREGRILNVRLDAAVEDLRQTRADAVYVAAERCECGGDTELYWRKRAVEAEKQAKQDRANALRLTDRIEYWRQRLDATERMAHIAEQLRRAQ
jgi:uncharacterized coiled-coil protein SlyX